MLYIVIAVFIVLIIMNIFMLLVLKQITASTGRQIEKDAVRLFAVYDRILEDRSQKLEELDDQILDRMERLQELGVDKGPAAAAPVLGSATVVTGKYRDESFAQDYRKIKESFQMDAAQVVSGLQERRTDEDRAAEVTLAVVQRILGKFSFDSRYELSTLCPEDQKAILEQFLEPEEREVYEVYQAETPEGDMLGFFEWLEGVRRVLDRSVTVRLADGGSTDGLGSDVRIEYAGDICEGFRILQGGRLYDYSI